MSDLEIFGRGRAGSDVVEIPLCWDFIRLYCLPYIKLISPRGVLARILDIRVNMTVARDIRQILEWIK